MKRKTHGLSRHTLYSVWHNMKQRCNNKNNKDYVYYGNRGIKVCDRWMDVTNFINDMSPTFKDGLTLDRINVNGNYQRENCRWVSMIIQTRNTNLRNTNTSSYRGVTWHKAKKKWNAKITVNYKRIHLGYFAEKIEAAKAYDKYIIDNNLEHTRNFS